MKIGNRIAASALVGLCLGVATEAQGTLADYQRGQSLRTKAQDLVVNQPSAPTWIGQSDHFWYSRSVKGGSEFILVDAVAGTKKLAFDHEKLAAAISAASGTHYTALKLPFAPMPGGRGGGGGGGRGGPAPGALRFVDDETAIEFGANGFLYRCSITEYTCSKGAALPATGGRGGAAAPEDPSPEYLTEQGGDPVDGLEYQPFPQQGGGGGGAFGRGPSGCATRPETPAPAQTGGRGGRGGAPAETPACRSFDGKWDALIQNYNVFLQRVGSKDPAEPLSYDGSEGNYYTLRSVA